MSNEFWKVHFILNWGTDSILKFDDLDNSRFLPSPNSPDDPGHCPSSRRFVIARGRWNHIFTITGHFAGRFNIYILEVKTSTVRTRIRDCIIVVKHIPTNCCRSYFSCCAFPISLMSSTIAIILCNMDTKRRRRYQFFPHCERTNREFMRLNLPKQEDMHILTFHDRSWSKKESSIWLLSYL